MTISVTNRGDGTFLVTCGTESVIVGRASGSGDPTPLDASSGTSGGSYPQGTTGSGGVDTAIWVPPGDAKLPEDVIDVIAAEDLIAEITKWDIGEKILGRVPTGRNLNFLLHKDATLDIGAFRKAVGVAPSAPISCRFYLSGLHDKIR